MLRQSRPSPSELDSLAEVMVLAPCFTAGDLGPAGGVLCDYNVLREVTEVGAQSQIKIKVHMVGVSG